MVENTVTICASRLALAYAWLCTTANRRLRIALAFAAAMPSDSGAWGSTSTSSTPSASASANQGLGWRSVTATTAGPWESLSASRISGGQLVGVGVDVPDQHLRRRLDDLDHARALEQVAERGVSP